MKSRPSAKACGAFTVQDYAAFSLPVRARGQCRNLDFFCLAGGIFGNIRWGLALSCGGFRRV